MLTLLFLLLCAWTHFSPCNVHGHICYMSGCKKPNLRKLRRRNYHNIICGLPENSETMDEDIVEALDSPIVPQEVLGKPRIKLTEVSESSDTDD